MSEHVPLPVLSLSWKARSRQTEHPAEAREQRRNQHSPRREQQPPSRHHKGPTRSRLRIHRKTHLSLHSVKQCKPPALTRMNRPKSKSTARNTVKCRHDSSGQSRAILPTIDGDSPQLVTTDRLSSSLGRPEPHCQTPRRTELPHSPTTCHE